MKIKTPTLHWCSARVSYARHHSAYLVAAKRMARAAGGYAAISQEEVETSLPRFATSPTRNGGRRRTDSHKDMDGNSYPAVRKQAT